MQKPIISMIAAIGRDQVLGKDNQLLWHIPDDLKRFKTLTLGHPVIMGRKTFDSIVATLGKALPGRTNIVVTRDTNWRFEDVVVCHSLEEALEKAKGVDQVEVFVIGGAQIYEQALTHTDKLYLTLINDEKEGDAFFPPYEHLFTKKTFGEEREWQGLSYTWVDLERA